MCVFVFLLSKIPSRWDILSLFRHKPAGYHALRILTMFLKQYRFPAFLLESCCLMTHRCCLKAFIHWMHFFCANICKKNILNCWLGCEVFLHRMRTSHYHATSRPSPTTITMLIVLCLSAPSVVWKKWDTNYKNINLKDKLWQSIYTNILKYVWNWSWSSFNSSLRRWNAPSLSLPCMDTGP